MRRKVCPGKAQECPAWLSHLRPFPGLQRPSRPPGCLLPQGLSGPGGNHPGRVSWAVLRTSVRQSPSWLRACELACPGVGTLPLGPQEGTLKTLNGHHPAQPSTHSPWKTQTGLMKGGSMVPRQGPVPFTLQILAECLLCQTFVGRLTGPMSSKMESTGNIQETSSVG